MPNAPARLLIVDDTVVNVRLMSSILQSQGYELYTAENGKQALEMVAKHKLDLLLLDINMPEMDGYEVCAYLKSQAKTRHIPVIFISTLDTVADKVRAFKVGAADYIPRPFQSEEVLMRVRNQLMLRSLQRQLKISNQQLARANQELEQSNQALSQVNDKLESTYRDMAKQHQALTENSQLLNQHHQELQRSHDHLAQENSKLERQVERRTAALDQLNETYRRFVPQAMLNLLKRPKIAQLQVGDQSQIGLNLLLLTAHQLEANNLTALNAWLAEINPIIQQYDGFIQTYLGHQLVAVFPDYSEDALQAALAVQTVAQQMPRLEACISLHHETLWLGILGDENRLQCSLEPRWTRFMQHFAALGRDYGAAIICSSTFFTLIEQHMRYAHRCLGCLSNPNNKSLDFFEVFPEQATDKAAKMRFKDRFEEALRDYQAKDFASAMQKWQSILEHNPQDQAAQQYLQKAAQLQKQLPPAWQACEALSF